MTSAVNSASGMARGSSACCVPPRWVWTYGGGSSITSVVVVQSCQKMLTKTVRQMECDGLVVRTVHPEIPPRVDYRLTPLGRSLGAALCGVWKWVVKHQGQIEAARRAFAESERSRSR